jgi:hypothetical protein
VHMTANILIKSLPMLQLSSGAAVSGRMQKGSGSGCRKPRMALVRHCTTR